MKTLEAWYGVPPDRDAPVVQLFLAGSGPLWGEALVSDGRLLLEVFPNPTGEPWVLPVDELRTVLQVAEERLRGNT